ncbi:LEAF RUST 10 DISEASE-RESISTANCE LOCUS RECEPTOR-LIKE PROTEIN KINASE-like 1.2 isoform X4 [Cornus florida]|uniref:LEAF RUST 10 DISEASE-RESISTANCE LOCUS RECEPTOR-LIKE PROTEIN KINASE-like 1.2 isoform X4 n=1 Tax=Cornus florida TaxID=4283 RepID=UPI00289B15E5|nr:LEAF RUST 10 DISEASE-RESISTANCE LOCUS RECEPTOR-LIKE PROTEIN KINASE-like 1.2 isoform X4 [Cornus florida]
MSQPLFLLSSSLFLFFFLTSYGNNIDSFATNCSWSMCGDVNISYPFWKIDGIATTPSDHCGYLGLGIRCSSEKAVLHLPNNAAYHVQRINYDNNTINLVDSSVTTDPKPTYPRELQNLILDSTVPLFHSQLDLDLSFYFNCEIHSLDTGHLPCCGWGGNKSCVFVAGKEPDGVDWRDDCEHKVVTKVLKSEINESDLINGYVEAINKGFVLDWGNATECRTCKESRALCGYANNELSCFCSDGPTKRELCKKGFCSVVIGILLMGLPFYFYHRRNKKLYTASRLISRNNSSYSSSMVDLDQPGTYLGLQIFSYSELEEATKKFDSEKILGDGGFGIVYLGKLKDGRAVAVKRLYENSYKRVEQFMNEIEILSRLRHQNLVSLYGCTSRHCRELILVYEYISNGTVADHLHGEGATPGSLAWTTRMSIAIETATALAYLHASDVIHRDVKTNNILLDNNFCVKVADFGLSRLYPTDVTHVSTAPQGTPGYVDPEYHDCYHLTKESDVYSFGVVLIELISSMPAVDITRKRHEINLSHLAISKIQSNALHELVDPSIGFESDYKVKNMVTDVAELAFQCLQNEREMRPSMEEVLEALIGIQRRDDDIQKTSIDIPADDVVLLKNNPPTLSPDSVTTKWISTSTSDFSG